MCRGPRLAHDDVVEERHLEAFTSCLVRDRSTRAVVLLGLSVPAFERSEEERIRVARHRSHIRRVIQGPEAENELVVRSIQLALTLFDGFQTSAVQLSAEGGTGGVADCKQAAYPDRL